MSYLQSNVNHLVYSFHFTHLWLIEATKVKTGSKHLKTTLKISIFPKWGSVASCARYLPRGVRSSSLSKAPKNWRFSMATLMEFADGASRAIIKKLWMFMPSGARILACKQISWKEEIWWGKLKNDTNSKSFKTVNNDQNVYIMLIFSHKTVLNELAKTLTWNLPNLTILTNLVYQSKLEFLEAFCQMDSLFADFSKAFNRVWKLIRIYFVSEEFKAISIVFFFLICS